MLIRKWAWIANTYFVKWLRNNSCHLITAFIDAALTVSLDLHLWTVRFGQDLHSASEKPVRCNLGLFCAWIEPHTSGLNGFCLISHKIPRFTSAWDPLLLGLCVAMLNNVGSMGVVKTLCRVSLAICRWVLAWRHVVSSSSALHDTSSWLMTGALLQRRGTHHICVRVGIIGHVCPIILDMLPQKTVRDTSRRLKICHLPPCD